MNPTENIKNDAEEFVPSLSVPNEQAEYEQEMYDDELGEKVKYIRTPNFTDCASANTQLPINVANESISILSRYRSEFDFVDFIKEKLNYNSRIAVNLAFYSEQVDALVLAIKQFESNKALILGDMAGIGKGRVVAGILRYAYQQKITPIFITEKENLFSEMYKDIMGIGGFGGVGGNVIEPKPFIMNPYTSDKKSVIQDDNGNELVVPLRNEEINRLLYKFNGDFPFTGKNKNFDFNCVFLTYNVISKTRGESGDNKRYFLLEIANNSIFVLDECHNASGRSKLGEWAKQYVTQAKGVMFSSATFAKNPQAFPLYIIKTAMAEAQIDITAIEEAIGVGGENVSEYISSVLVKEGQMIRRERDFTGCTMGTVFDGYDKVGQEAEESKERIYSLFDSAVSRFRSIYNYIKQASFVNAIKQSITRKAEELGFDLAPQEEYIRAKIGSGEAKETEQRDFIRRYRGRWIVHKYDTNTLGATTKFHFSENLLLAIKAKFVADAIIKELQTEAEYTYFDGKKKKSNRKPVIALRATGENLFKKLNLKNGDVINNDFSEYVKAVVSGVMSGKVVFRKVNNDLFTPKWLMEENDKEYQEEAVLYTIENEDLPDGGNRLNQLLDEVNSFNADIPLSTIDYLIDRIQSVQRKSWDRFGSVSSYYKVGEVTGRNYALIKEGEGRWVLSTNERERSVKTAFNNFNSGKTDVLIINSSGSTGGSIQSNENFSDQRPRIMFLTQLELDVNTEVQKRGRINRSGQVNYPAYLYVLSQIPSEMRKFLSLKRKLRRLDANTSANQTQNSDLVGITDKEGKPIQDIFNIYGEEAFQRFIQDEDNFEYKDIYDQMTENFATEAYAEVYVQEGNMVKALLQPFSRELEIYGCDLQQGFYDQMNTLYSTVISEHKNNGTYQLELDIEDLKASLRSRVVRQINSGLTEFSKPLFMEDKYCLERKRLWTKEKLDSEIIKMATAFYKDRSDDFTNITNFHNDLIQDFEQTYDNFIEEQANKYRGAKEPIRNEYSSEEDYNTALSKYEEGLASILNRYESDRSLIYELISWYKPNRNVMVADIVGSGENVNTVYRQAKFVGYTLKATSLFNKYSKGSIHFKFAFMGGSNPSAEYSLSLPQDIAVLQESKRNSVITFSAPQQIGSKTMGELANEKINAWEVNPNVRRTVRFLSGNILSGIQMANQMEDISRWSLVRYTNNDGSISTGIRLQYPEDIFSPLATELSSEISQTIQVTLNNPNIINYLKETPTDYVFYVAVNTYRSQNVEPAKNGTELMVKGLIRIAKPSGDMNRLFVYIFQGQPDLRGLKNEETRALVVANTPFKNSSNSNNPIFFAPFLNNYTVYQTKSYNKEYNPYRIENDTFTNPDGYRNKSGVAKVYEFKDINTPEGERLLSNFLAGLFDEQPLSLEFPQNINDYYNIQFLTDTYEAPVGKEKKKQTLKIFDEGDYEYKLEVDYDDKYQKSPPPAFVRYEKGKGIFDKGTVILNQPILPTFAKAYNIYPANLSNDDTVKLLLSIFAQDEKAEFINELTQKAEAGKSASVIGDYVSTVAKRRSVPDLKYIFGNRRINDIGELLKTYALKGDISKIQTEIVEETAPQELKPKRKKNDITVADAEKFINYLLF